MSQAHTTAEPIAVGNSAKGNAAPLARGFRFALTVLVVVVCCYVAYGFGKFWALWRQTRQPVATQQSDSIDLSPIGSVLPLAGPWSFDELDWNLRSQLVEMKEVETLFASLAATAPAATESQLPETDQKIIDLITALQVRPTEQRGNQVYRLDRSDFKAQLVARNVAGQTRTVVFVIAYPQSGDEWQIYEFTPRTTATNSDTNANASHLLPLPAAARRSGGRYADDGQVLLELISLEASAEQLLAAWKDAGWEVRPSGLTDPADFSFLCARGEDVVYAWSADPPESLQNLMLVRTAAPSDTSP
jgi:hypothetical protein